MSYEVSVAAQPRRPENGSIPVLRAAAHSDE
jgi:hypothetical protein